MTSASSSPIAPPRPDVRRDVRRRDIRATAAAQPDGGRCAARPVGAGTGTGDGDRGGPVDAPDLRLVARRPSPATFWRRRLTLAAGLVVVGLLLLGVVGQVSASADLADRVDGHVIVEPGQTLWDIAVVTAPDGIDARSHLAAIEDLNGIRADEVQAWNVILLPAR